MKRGSCSTGVVAARAITAASSKRTPHYLPKLSNDSTVLQRTTDPRVEMFCRLGMIELEQPYRLTYALYVALQKVYHECEGEAGECYSRSVLHTCGTRIPVKPLTSLRAKLVTQCRYHIRTLAGDNESSKSYMTQRVHSCEFNPIVHDDTAFVPNMMLINECSQPHHQPRFKLVHQLLELQSQRHRRTEYRHDTVIPLHGPSSCKNRNRVPRVRLSSTIFPSTLSS